MAIAALFGEHGLSYQAVSAQAAEFHAQFVQALSGAGASYAAAEAANASPLQTVLDAINAPTQTLLGRPLIGDGADGTAPARMAGPVGCCTATAATASPRRPPGWPVVPAGPPG
jgi:hypothetical protein